MKRSILPLALSLALLLTSCSTLLERDYLVTADHTVDAPAKGEGYYRVETYSALAGALNSYLEAGLETGILRFPTTYPSNLAVDLEKATRHLLEEDPLGCYALADLSYHTSRIISYYEVELTFRYRPRIDRSTLSGIRRVSGAAGLEDLFAQTLSHCDKDLTFYLTMTDTTPDAVRDILLRAYDRDPSLALGLPAMTLELYPEGAIRSIVVVSLRYPGSYTTLRSLQEQVLSAARELVSATQDPGPVSLLYALHSVCALDPDAGSTVDAALLQGAADREGLAHAYQLLCTEAGIPCSMVRENNICRIRVALPNTGETADVDPTDPDAFAAFLQSIEAREEGGTAE